MNNTTKEQEVIRLLVDIRNNIITGTETQYEIKKIYTKDVDNKKYYICETSIGDVELDFQKVNNLLSMV
jgi:hypothetical protein